MSDTGSGVQGPRHTCSAAARLIAILILMPVALTSRHSIQFKSSLGDFA